MVVGVNSDTDSQGKPKKDTEEEKTMDCHDATYCPPHLKEVCFVSNIVSNKSDRRQLRDRPIQRLFSSALRFDQWKAILEYLSVGSNIIVM